MSKYTTLLRWPIEQRLDELGLERTEQNWPRVYGFLGLDDYPIYEESHRKTLNDKIIRRYYMREIGFETMGLFVWNLRTHMHEVMPYYNELYKTVGLIVDPLSTKDMSFDETWTRDESESDERTSRGKSTENESTQGNSDSHTTQTGSTASSDRNVFQDTPMNGLDTGAVEGMDYATNVTFDKGTTDSESQTDVNSRTDGNRDTSGSTSTDENGSRTGDFEGSRSTREHGYDRPQAETLLTYRKAIINIDLEVVESCAALFMGLW